MGIPVLAALDRLITEHGSAAILRDHLSVFRDQLVVSEKERELLAAKAAVLEKENAALKAENQALRAQLKEIAEKEKVRGNRAKHVRRTLAEMARDQQNRRPELG